MRNFSVEIDDFNKDINWNKEFDNIKEAINYYQSYAVKKLYSVKLIDNFKNEEICSFCNDNIED